ncbi:MULTISPECIES: exopolysaccharide biosynthesis GT4 family glycosyltransferase EpsE [Mameliella]|uniref:exopolysaccharide biosynthesis GT4 family glycosyltransferase EpsE n=1 Tax=Mameliella TaxID=1434019 RepID=UPI00068C45A5|nr:MULTISPECIES: exopolysaccharide biosynthesis GT4 family glycosyltransferase EpsE [Mameliella]MBV6635254.1 glycosyltransferase family 4 protein [Mameliella sp.]MBY6121165.1 glycosyltransferase family 4 protein [Mameliella alba]OWV41534.1 colanic acid biosynthesis glycosyltransferase WcaL [Mameliella alba]OWV61185.1 colanic acid biosynthesis glycosyltransferase WcaL [Mameliella alba]OWV61530.1 colanic acid biosynthesis glycosyltransferase WcaL [Mameliella alba]
MRIGYIVPQFPGQTHIFFWREIRALEAMGHEVHVFSTRKPPRRLISHDWSDRAIARTTYLGHVDPLPAAVALAKLSTRGLPLWMLREGPGFARDALITMAAAERLRREAAARGLDHIHAHSCGRVALIACFAHLMGGPRYSLTLHGPLSDYGPGQRVKWRHASFATIITRKILAEIEETLAGSLPERRIIRPMGVDTEKLQRRTPYQPPEHGRPIRIFACGRLNVVKGHQDLMAATRQLLDQGVDVRVEIAGEDDDGGTGYRIELEETLKRLRLQDHVKLLGAIDAGEVKDKLEESHLFVLASWHEPLGVAYMEAMSMGVPTIGTDAGGVPELITDGSTGYLVEPKNPGMLARTIRSLVGDPDALMRLSEAGRLHIVENFRASLGAEVLVEEIERLRTPATGPEA